MLSSDLKSPSPITLSQTARRRIKIDNMIDKTASNDDGSTMMEMMMMLDERQAARELAYRRERDEAYARLQADRELARAEERKLREEREERVAARDAQNQQMMMMMMAKIFGAKNDA